MLEGKVAIVTGGSSGIGKAIANLFAKKGANLVLIARNKKRLEDTITSLSGNNHAYFSLDIIDGGKASETIKNIADKYGRIDILVNNAGIFAPANIGDMKPEEIKGTFAGYEGAVQLTNLIAPIFKKQNSGIILDVLSIAALQIYGGNSVYGSIKRGHMDFSKRIEEELKQYNIKVYRIYPGNTNTGLWNRDQTKLKEMIIKNNQLKAEDIAREAYNLINNKYKSRDLMVYPDENGNKVVEEVK